MARGISVEVERDILKRSVDGSSCREIAEWLQKRHGIKKSREAISKLVSGHRKERGEVAKSVVREHLQRTLPSDLAILDEQVRSLRQLAQTTRKKPKEIDQHLRVVDRLLRVIDTKLHYSGADTPDPEGPQTDADADARLARRLARLVADAGPRENPGEPVAE